MEIIDGLRYNFNRYGVWICVNILIHAVYDMEGR